jgi:histidinol-phosphatase
MPPETAADRLPSAELDAALAAARAANRLVRAHYGRAPGVTIKSDASPVTVADVAVEGEIRRQLTARFPGYGFLGEESGHAAGVAGSPLWIVDPIDGTRAFIREFPMFSTQIALRRGDEMALGVSSAPVYGEMAWTERGNGAFLNGRPLAVSSVADLGEAQISLGNSRSLAAGERWARYGRLVASVAYSRGYGEFLQYHLLAAGKLDVVIETDIKIYDIAALAAIVTEAGGRCTDIDGAPLDLATTSIVASNGLLHDRVLDILSGR